MIELKNVDIIYPLMQFNSHSLRANIFHFLQNYTGIKGHKPVNFVKAIDDMSLKINPGERVGLIGHNGAGKTTLLNTINLIYPPSRGTVHVKGKISSLIDTTLGMDANISGLKNIIFRLVFMGKTFKEANAAVNKIVEFSGLGADIDRPIYTYSSGMYLKLAFAIATFEIPDVLIMDEVIGAGDEAFRNKAFEKINEIMNKSRIVVLSSHDLSAIKYYCNRVIMLSKGRIEFDGQTDEAIEYYIKKNGS